MAELLNDKRARFAPGKQGGFIESCMANLGATNAQLAKTIGASVRTLTDWKREKFLMPIGVAKFLSKKSNIMMPKIAKVEERFWYTRNGSSAGGLAVYRKYGRIGGDPKYRERKWREWWKNIGRFKPHPIINVSTPIKIPRKSERLAEFIGIAMGDGGISKYQLTITLNRYDDKKYGRYVINIIKKLFGVRPKVYDSVKKSVLNIVVSRRELVRFCTEKLGLVVGNKVRQGLDVPRWIKRNRNFRIACVRGLVDTDGCVFTHKYKVGRKWYKYKKLSFTSISRPLAKSVHSIMKNLGLNPRFSQNKDVRLDSVSDMKKYFGIVGSSNPKHLKRYKK